MTNRAQMMEWVGSNLTETQVWESSPAPAPEPDGAALMSALLAKPSRIKMSKSRAKKAEPKKMIRVCMCGSTLCPAGPFNLVEV